MTKGQTSKNHAEQLVVFRCFQQNRRPWKILNPNYYANEYMHTQISHESRVMFLPSVQFVYFAKETKTVQESQIWNILQKCWVIGVGIGREWKAPLNNPNSYLVATMHTTCLIPPTPEMALFKIDTAACHGSCCTTHRWTPG